jgi:hypothetical protein
MRSLIKVISFATVFLAFALDGCGGSGSGGSTGAGSTTGTGANDGTITGPITPTSGPYQPLVMNATWTYHVNDKGVQYDKMAVFEGIDNGNQYRMNETIPNQKQLTWYTNVSDTIVGRVHEQNFDTSTGTDVLKSEDIYDPYRLRVDTSPEHTTAGATWTWTFNDTHSSRSKPTATASVTEGWTTVGVDIPVGVPAGNFASLKVTHMDPTDPTSGMKTYWFVKGVGKVREETTAGHIEELTSYMIPSQ